jgi:NAD(P)-dependent dehydrogenase (short-subunit alcohol dehydrogenase family)
MRDNVPMQVAEPEETAPVPPEAAPADAANGHESVAGIDPERLQIALDVIAQLDHLPLEHPDQIAIQRATASLYKNIKLRRRNERRDRILANDNAVTARTATGAPGRIDDETAGIPLVSNAKGATAGELLQPRGCYVCKERYTTVDAFYHQLCPECAAFNHAKRDARTDLTGRRALLTGGRAKIGMYIALRLLRDGAHTTITTRFPKDAARRFAAMDDAADWLHRLRIVGIDLRDPAQVVALADDIAAQGPLDIIINNACQTVRRSPQAYAPLVAGEREQLPPLSNGLQYPEITAFGRSSEFDRAHSIAGGAHTAGSEITSGDHWVPTPETVTALALTARSATEEMIQTGTAIDAGGLVPDLHDTNSWVQAVQEVDPVELLEVQLCNQTAPFILIGKLRAAMRASTFERTHIVNVSAMEGVFNRGYKGAGHPHTNMSKAALNMLTRTSAREMFESDGIQMCAVDTGWITDERPHPDKVRLADIGFHAPLDLVDGAARVYDPIVRGEAGEILFGTFQKDYQRGDW